MTRGKSTQGARIFIVAGEESGDGYGADLVRAMLSRRPDLSLTGIGGEQMGRAGVEIISQAEKISVVGLIEVLEKAPYILKAYLRAKRSIKNTPFSAAILIDFPDFNLRLARVAKSYGIPVFYYISPQVWAWRKGRVRSIASSVHRMLVILPFEEPFYKEHGVEVEYVGHPLVDRIRPFTRGEAPAPEWEESCPVIGLMPGSRDGEVSAILPTMLRVAIIIKRVFPGARLILLLSRGVGEDKVRKLLQDAKMIVELQKGPNYHVMSRFNYLIAASGTATLEAALLRIPMVIIYRGHFLSWLLSKPFIKVPHIGLPNLIAGKRLVPEFRQYEATAERIAVEALRVLRDKEEYLRMREGLKCVAAQVGEGGAAGRVAEAILSRLEI